MDQFDMKWGILGKVGVILQLGGAGQKKPFSQKSAWVFLVLLKIGKILAAQVLLERLNWSF